MDILCYKHVTCNVIGDLAYAILDTIACFGLSDKRASDRRGIILLSSASIYSLDG
jgi:hypothetical protein